METTTRAARTQSSTSMSESSSSVVKLLSGDRQVRVLKLFEYKKAAQCLAEAFKDDEVAGYPVKTPDRQHWTAKQQWGLHVHVMECLAKAHIMRGMVTAIGPNYDCVALWMPPGQDFDDFCCQLRSGLLTLRFKFSKEGRVRFFDEFFPLLHKAKHEALGEDEPHAWYLVYIGTKPSSRGKGFAKTLMEYTTKQADAENRLCYLESSNVLNLKLYNRLGFEAVGKKAVLKRGPKPVEMEIMVRKPVIDQLAGNTAGLGVACEMRVGANS